MNDTNTAFFYIIFGSLLLLIIAGITWLRERGKTQPQPVYRRPRGTVTANERAVMRFEYLKKGL